MLSDQQSLSCFFFNIKFIHQSCYFHRNRIIFIIIFSFFLCFWSSVVFWQSFISICKCNWFQLTWIDIFNIFWFLDCVFSWIDATCWTTKRQTLFVETRQMACDTLFYWWSDDGHYGMVLVWIHYWILWISQSFRKLLSDGIVVCEDVWCRHLVYDCASKTECEKKKWMNWCFYCSFCCKYCCISFS